MLKAEREKKSFHFAKLSYLKRTKLTTMIQLITTFYKFYLFKESSIALLLKEQFVN